jgi:hypothetical protein
MNIRFIRGEHTDKRIQDCYYIIMEFYREVMRKRALEQEKEEKKKE